MNMLVNSQRIIKILIIFIHDAFQIKDKITNKKLNILKSRNPWGSNLGKLKTILPNNFKMMKQQILKKKKTSL